MSRLIFPATTGLRWSLLLIPFLLPQFLAAARSYPPEINGAEVEVFKEAGGVELKAWIYQPERPRPEQKLPAIVFFFGGGWVGGSPAQFEPFARYLANRGMVSVLADYRVKSRHGVDPADCVADAKSAIRWVRRNAERLGIDPDRIVASGGSAGGHLAASTALLPLYDEPGEDAAVSSRPDALALFNPVLVLGAVSGQIKLDGQRWENLSRRLKVEPATLSPFHNLENGLPPTIIFHGTDDTTVPFETIQLFSRTALELGYRCELVAYSGQGHGFFNEGRAANTVFADVLHRLDAFLVSLGNIEGPPPVTVYK